MSEDIAAQVSAILAEGGYSPMPGPPFAGLFCVASRDGYWLGGVKGGSAHSAHTHMSDPPKDPLELARFLVSLGEPNPLATEATLEPITLAEAPEAEETPQHESDIRDSDAGNASAELGEAGGVSAEHADGGSADEPGAEWDGALASDADPIDADFDVADLGRQEELEEELADLPALEPTEPEEKPEEPEEEAPQGQDRFIGLDDLDRRRSLRIGDTIRYANGLMPAWSIEDDARLATLRNFAMGVSEKRWDDNPANQAELNALETTIRRINEIKNARDAKVEFLESASREDVEAFVVEADWP